MYTVLLLPNDQRRLRRAAAGGGRGRRWLEAAMAVGRVDDGFISDFNDWTSTVEVFNLFRNTQVQNFNLYILGG